NFAAVIAACAGPRRGVGGTLTAGTWITQSMQAAYQALHELGYAHSVETWMEGRLVGGLYGVALGRAFYGESMFSPRRDASTIALVALARRLEAMQFGLIDCQMVTEHLASMGARAMPRRQFCRLLAKLVDYPAAMAADPAGAGTEARGSWAAASYSNQPH